MAKLMEIIEKNPDFKKGVASMRLLDTTFSQLTRKIGQLRKTYNAVEKGDMLSKEVLQSLNADQLALKEMLILWQQDYNNYIDSIKSKITTAEQFNYTFTSLVDYTSKYEANKTLADYYLLTEFVNAEKELYEFGHYWGREHMRELLFKMKEWSKRKNYGSCVGEVKAVYETYHTGYQWTILDNAGLTLKLDLEGHTYTHDKCHLWITGLQNIKLGEKRLVKIKCFYGKSSFGFGYFEITRNSLNCYSQLNDDGYFTFKVWEEGMDKVREGARVTKWTEIGSPHFDIEKPTLKKIKALKLL